MGCWDDGGGWVRVGVRGWAISSSGRTAPRSGNMSLSGRYPEHDICEDFNATQESLFLFTKPSGISAYYLCLADRR
jgi:hypothetical protein